MADFQADRAVPPAPGHRCPRCGGEIPGQSGPGRRRWWCSPRCKREANGELRQWRVRREALFAELERYQAWVDGSGGPWGRDRAASLVRGTLEKLGEVDAEVARLEAMTDPRQATRASV